MPQVMRHISIYALDPAQHRRRRIHALEPHALQIQNRRQDRLHCDEVREQDLGDGVARVDEGLELVVGPARGRVVQQHEGGVGFDGVGVRGCDGAEEDVSVGALGGGEGEDVEVVEG